MGHTQHLTITHPEYVDAIIDIIAKDVPRYYGFIYASPYKALQSFGPDSCQAVEVLNEIIMERRADCNFAIATLGYLGECSESSTTILKDLLANSDERMDFEIMKATILTAGQIGEPLVKLVPELGQIICNMEDSEEISNGDWSLGIYAIDSLAAFQSHPSYVRCILENIIQRENKNPQLIHASLTLYKLGINKYENKMRIFDALYDENEDLTFHALWACKELGPIASDMLPRIQELITQYSYVNERYRWEGILESIRRDRCGSRFFG